MVKSMFSLLQVTWEMEMIYSEMLHECVLNHLFAVKVGYAHGTGASPHTAAHPSHFHVWLVSEGDVWTS